MYIRRKLVSHRLALDIHIHGNNIIVSSMKSMEGQGKYLICQYSLRSRDIDRKYKTADSVECDDVNFILIYCHGK